MRTREFQQGYYIRDNWTVTRKLSVNLGLRMEHYPIMNRGEFGIERYDPDTNTVLLGGRGSIPRDGGTEAITIMFAPRIGLAYRFDERTVLRAGFGITNDPYPMGRPLRSPYPVVIAFTYETPTNAFVPAGSLATGIPAPVFPDVSSGVLAIPNAVTTVSLQPGTYRRGYIESFNLTIQRDLAAGFVLQTGYVGTRSIRQGTSFNFNAGIIPGAGQNGRPLNLRYGRGVDTNFYIPMAMNRYDAWQSNITRRFQGGLFLTSSYTWSKAIGLNAGNSDSGMRYYVPSAFYRNRVLTDFDRTHSWVTAATYELPFGKGKSFATSGAAAAILGGWQLAPNMAVYSGLPFTVGADGSSLAAPGNTQTADQIKAGVEKLGGVGPGAPFYDPTAFRAVVDAQGRGEARFGNTGVNLLRGPRLFTLHLGVHRKFQISERFDLQFRAEALNLTNTPTLSNPNATVTTPANFMIITSTQAVATSAQRTLRFGLRLAF